MSLEDLASKAMTYASKLGARYADIRIEKSVGESFLLENGKVEHVAVGTDEGAGIRALTHGAWGFYATSKLTENDVLKAVELAVKLAKASDTRIREVVRLADVKVVEDKDIVKVKQKPEDYPLEERVKLAKDCDSAMRKTSDRIHKAAVAIGTDRLLKLFHSTEGTRISYDYSKSYIRLEAIAHQIGLTESVGREEGGTGGVERIIEPDPIEISENIAKKAIALLKAPTPSAERLPVILDQDYVALLTHEILGHPSEADRVLGREAAWAGVAWWKGMLYQQVGSEFLNASDDPRIEGGLGYYRYDDEGVPAEEKELIKGGILTNHMHSRETAAIFGVKPNAGMRASSYRFVPLIRMSNTFIKPGDWTFEEMLEDVHRGVYVVGNKIPSIDMRRYNWQISAQWGFMIEKGELTKLLRDVTVAGIAPEFFKSIDAVGKDFQIRPVPSCGKGDPMQGLHVGNGGPHIRGIAIVQGTRST